MCVNNRKMTNHPTSTLPERMIMCSGAMLKKVASVRVYFLLHEREEHEVPFHMAIGNKVLLHECFPRTWRTGTQE